MWKISGKMKKFISLVFQDDSSHSPVSEELNVRQKVRLQIVRFETAIKR